MLPIAAPIRHFRLLKTSINGNAVPISPWRARNPPSRAFTSAETKLVDLSMDRTTRVATITLCNPRRRNSLSLAALKALGEALDAVNPGWSFRSSAGRDWVDLNDIHAVKQSNANRDIRCVIIRADYGDVPAEKRVFSSGHDLKELSALDLAGRRELFEVSAKTMMKIRQLPQIVVAEADGLATAAGLQLFCQADLSVAGPMFRCMFPGVNLGGFCTTPSIPASRLAPQKRIFRMLSTAELVGPEEALQAGLASHVAAPGSLPAFTEALAGSIGKRAPYGTFIGKWAFWKQAGMPLEEAYALGAQVMAEVRELEDAKIGVEAWLAGKRPEWNY